MIFVQLNDRLSYVKVENLLCLQIEIVLLIGGIIILIYYRFLGGKFE